LILVLIVDAIENSWWGQPGFHPNTKSRADKLGPWEELWALGGKA
jgi:hypothetical protein